MHLAKGEVKISSRVEIERSMFVTVTHMKQMIYCSLFYRVVRRNLPTVLSLYYYGLRGCTNLTLYMLDTYIPKVHVGMIEILIS